MDKLKEIKDLTEIKAALDKSEAKFKELRADCCVNDQNQEMYYKVMDACYLMVQNLRQYIYSVEDNMWKMFDEHKKNHPPKLMTATHLQNYLEACGMENDIEIVKPTIYIQASKNGIKSFEVDLNLK